MDAYILDFACVELKLAIELDGGQHVETQASDKMRTKSLEESGWKVLRFWNNEVLRHTENVVEQIYNALSKR